MRKFSTWAMRRTLLSLLVFDQSGNSRVRSAGYAARRLPKTMDEVIDRIVNNENQLNDRFRKYSPLVETYIQNLKPDKDLGYVPAGDKYFLGKARFRQGREPGFAFGHRQQGQKNLLAASGISFRLRCSICPTASCR